MSSSRLMEPFKPMRTTKWSSTTMIRIFFSTVIGFDLVRRAQGRLGGGVGGAQFAFGGDLNEDFRALAGGADHRVMAAHFLRALAHVKQTEMAAVSDGGVGGVEADAIVADAEGNFAGLIIQLDGDAGGLGVLEGVGQSL